MPYAKCPACNELTHYFLREDAEWREVFGDKPAPVKCFECYLDSKVEMDRLRAEVQNEKDREHGLQ